MEGEPDLDKIQVDATGEESPKSAEMSLAEELALKDRALAASAEGITISDARLPDNPLIYANEGFERLTGYSVRNILGRNCRFLQGPKTDPAAIDVIRRALREERECVVELLNHRKDGTPFWNRLSITPISDASGRVTHFIGIQTDITARKKAEEALVQAKQELETSYRRVKFDLEMAARIQQTLLPSPNLSIPGVEVRWVLKSCDELAGDTLNILKLDKNHVGFYLIDVSGHGVGAALLSFTLNRWLSSSLERSSLFRPKSSRRGSGYEIMPPALVATQLNRQFSMDLNTTQYFTLFYGVLDVRTGRFRYVNAGHSRPIYLPVFSDPVQLPGSGYPVGVLLDVEYQEQELHLRPGDRIYLYTDGLTELSNSVGDEYGIRRMTQVVQQGRHLGLQESIDALIDSVEQWSGSSNYQDDVSLLAFQFVRQASSVESRGPKP
jgi:sigma-B regulation protein RsbU (phosphoserine phosphatase)